MTTVAASSTAYEPPPNGFRTFVILWVSQSISHVGSFLTFFAANIWLVQSRYPLPEQRAELAFALSATSLAYGIPGIFGAPLAGAWVDRHDRKQTMFVVGLVNAALCLLLVVLLLTVGLSLWLLLPIIMLYAASEALFAAAFDTSYAMLVPEPLLPRANGMMQTMMALSPLFAPAFAATLISLPALARQGTITGGLGHLIGRFHDGTAFAFAVDALTFCVTALVLLFLTIPSPRPTAHTGQAPHRLWSDVRFGFSYIWRRRPLLWLLLTFALANLTGTPIGILEPLLVKFQLAADWTARGFSYESALALLTTAAGAGGVAGGLLVSIWGGLRRQRIYGVLIPMILSGCATLALGLSQHLFLAVGGIFCSVFMAPLLNAHSQTIWQTQTPREIQGRVFAVRRLIAQCTVPLSSLLAGLLGGWLGPGPVIAGCGVTVAIFCLAQLFNPALRHVEDPALREQIVR